MYLLDSVNSTVQILYVALLTLLKSVLADTLANTISIALGVITHPLVVAYIISILVKYPASVSFRTNVCSESVFPRFLIRSLIHSPVNFVDERLTVINQLVHLRDDSLEQFSNIFSIPTTIDVSK